MIADASLLHLPMLLMLLALIAVLVLSARGGALTRGDAAILIAGYAMFTIVSATA